MKKALLLIGALSLAAAGGEILLRTAPSRFRLAYERDRYMHERDVLQWTFCEPDRDPLIRWHNVPGKEGVFANKEFRTRIRINAQGMRGPEAAGGKDSVLVLGDSVAFGWGVEEEEAFVSRLAARFPKLRFLNAAVSGDDTASEWGYLRRMGDKLKPGRVLLVFYPNDPIEAFFLEPYRRGEPQPYRGLKRSYLVSFLKQLPQGLRRRGERPYYHGANGRIWDNCASHLDSIYAWCWNRRIPFDVVYVPLKDELGEPRPMGYHRLVRDYCAKLGIPFHDLTPAVQALPDPAQAYFRLDDHPTPAGHAAFAQALEDLFSEDSSPRRKPRSSL